MKSRQQLEREFALLREIRIRKARKDLWEYCKLRAPEFYKEGRWHLKFFCWVLQALYEGRLTKQTFREASERIAPKWFVDTFDWDGVQENITFRNLQVNLPPRHGKSRTLIMFCEWLFGQDITNRIITASYNESLATDFSRFTRDGISEEKVFPHEIVYSDIFPGIKVADGNSSYKQWALEGQFFSYKGAGIGGSVTGRGGNALLVDDPCKNAEEAFNELALDKQWQWFTGTFLSRQEQRKNSFKIVNMTRWSKKDICGRLLSGRGAKRWLVLKIPVESPDGTEMLCEEVFSRQMFEELKEEADPLIVQANYYQEPIDVQGLLYKEFKTYDRLPKDEDGNLLFEKIIAYGDTADSGDDYLCVPIAGVYLGELYMLDVVYTQDGMEVTEPLTADTLTQHDVTHARIESNSGGKSFARNVERLIWERHNTRKVHVEWMHQSKNKEARILSNSVYVMKHIHMPVDWQYRWPEYYKAMTEYQRSGKNKHDDAPDATTGLVEMMDYTPQVVEEPVVMDYETLYESGSMFDLL